MVLKLIKFASTVIILALAALSAALFLIDPNNYKDLIQQKTLQSTGIRIEIEGDIAWSLYPIGFDVKGLSIFDQDGALFTRVESMQLALDTMSLLFLKPQIEGVYASGANIVFKRDRHGNNNWENLLSQHLIASSESEGAPQHDEQPKAQTNAEGRSILFIPAQHIGFRDLTIRYDDDLNKQDIVISELNIEVSGATLAKAFPLNLSYQFASDALSLSFTHELETRIEVSPDLQRVHLIDLINNVDATGAFGRNRAVKLSLTGDIELALDRNELVARNMQISGAGLAVDTNFTLLNNDTYPNVKGNVSVAPFALSSVNQHLGLDLGVNNNAFRSVEFQTPFELKNNKLTLPTFDLKLDSSQFLGRMAYHAINQTLDLNIKGDNLDIDHYLAALDTNYQVPLAQKQSRTVLGAINSPDSASVNTDHKKAILPIEAMREIDAEVTFVQDSLRYSDLILNDIRLDAKLSENTLLVDQLDARLFGGQLQSNASITLNKSPVWKLNGNIAGVNLEPLLASVVSDLPLSPEGLLNATFVLDAKGNSISELLSQNKGNMNFDIADGALNNLNLDHYMCEGIALINREKLSSDWKEHTNFRSLTSKNTLLNGILNTDSINIETPSLQAYGTGRFTLESTRFRYNLAVKPLGIPSDTACIVNSKFSNLEIPLKCTGSVNSDSESPTCALDKQRISGLMEQLAKDEASRKLEKELDRGFDKQIGEYIDKDSELGKQLKKSILSIFN